MCCTEEPLGEGEKKYLRVCVYEALEESKLNHVPFVVSIPAEDLETCVVQSPTIKPGSQSMLKMDYLNDAYPNLLFYSSRDPERWAVGKELDGYYIAVCHKQTATQKKTNRMSTWFSNPFAFLSSNKDDL